MKLPLFIRALVIAGVAILVLFPISLIEGKISERRARADDVVRQFAAETSAAQVVAGPLLALTCEETIVGERVVMRGGKEETVPDKRTAACPTAYFSPRTLKVNGNVPVESRRRGIYEIRLYRADIELAGEFEWPAPAAWNGLDQREWKRAYLVMAVSDTRGIKAVTSTLSAHLAQGRGEGLEGKFALREELGDYAARKAGTPLAFGYRMELLGTSSLHIAPVGDSTEIRLASNWPHPSFGGAWTPDERQITSLGFDAVWRTTHLSTGGRALWDKQAREGTLAASGAAAGVALFDPINVYALSYRATQYAFLFVLFTFSALALTEILAGVRLHAIQYALVGSAIAVFFLLLIALSEHIAFGEAYAAAASACVLLLTFYLRHPLGSLRRAAGFFSMFVGLYGTLYVLLKSEDHALLMGSAMVFAVLAVAMIATRKLDWGAVGARMQT
ncbi:MAG: cell envelope integrity protein CreD [Usitatibacter sp.]